MKVTKESISAMEIAEDVKNSLLGIFDDITSKQQEIENLKAKVPTDSQKVVENTDWDKYQSLLADIAKKEKEFKNTLPNDEKPTSGGISFCGLFD